MSSSGNNAKQIHSSRQKSSRNLDSDDEYELPKSPNVPSSGPRSGRRVPAGLDAGDAKVAGPVGGDQVERGKAATLEPTVMKLSAGAVDLAALRGVRDMLSNRRGNRGKLSKSAVRLDLPLTFSFTTTAGTTYTTPYPLVPSNSSEWSALVALYDEMIVDGGVMHFCSCATGYTTNTAQIGVWTFDPLNISAIGSLVNGVQHSQHMLFNAQANATIASPLSTTGSGLHRFAWRTPRGSARSVTSTSLFGHEWSSTGDTGDVYGYLKPYINPTGATGTTDYVAIVVLHVRFRCRS